MKILALDSRETDYSDIISEKLAEWNAAQGCVTSSNRMSVVALDDTGKFMGGANILAKWNYVLVDNLICVNPKNGTGRKIMLEIEKIAKDLKKSGVWLCTGAFQAKGFYEKLGYKEIGRIPEFSGFHDEIFFIKKI